MGLLLAAFGKNTRKSFCFEVLGEWMNRLVSLLILLLISCHSQASLFPAWKSLDEFSAEWFSKHLRAANEKPIYIDGKKEIYRFTWLRSFHEPIIIRIECSQICNLSATVLSGKGGYEPGNIQTSISHKLSTEQHNKFKQLLSKIDGWEYKPDPNLIMMDGAQWILEVMKSNSYQAWDINSPSGNYRKFCEYMLQLSKITVSKSKVY